MQPVLFDSSVYINALRLGDESVLAVRYLAPEAPLWLSAVVLEELYAGVRMRDRKVVDRLEHDFDRTGRILVPSLSDWAQAGRVLALLGAQYGYEHVGRGRLTNDTLIAMSAGRHGITVITTNERDFARLREFRHFHYEVRSLSLS
jgi:predicted nucleic acid-binding protein